MSVEDETIPKELWIHQCQSLMSEIQQEFMGKNETTRVSSQY